MITFNRIDSFSGPNEFLSNFHGGSVTIDGYVFKTAEHAYQAAKATNTVDFLTVCNCATPGIAKRAGRKIKVDPSWEQIKVGVMRKVLVAKFSNDVLARKLVATYPQYLEEGNTWGDVFWGVCGGKGQNMLGKLLMEVRDELISKHGTTDPSI